MNNLCGDRDPIRISRRCCAAWRTSARRRNLGAARFVHWEKPVEFTAVVRAFANVCHKASMLSASCSMLLLPVRD